jgi:uncharacterized protein YwqG
MAHGNQTAAENAVVIQPGMVTVPTQAISNGPTLYRMVPRAGHDRLVAEPCEYQVQLAKTIDPELASEDERWQKSDEANHEYHAALGGNKVGGTPGFLQGDEFPGAEFKRLILQLDSTMVPFSVNFGDCGIGFAFLSNDGCTGKFLWQCA